MYTEIVTIGNELLNGQTVDTNSSWMAQQLTLAGIKVSRITKVSDSGEAITGILKETEERADIVIMTGGLGPTSDDVTKPALCDFFDTRLVFREEIFRHIKALLGKRGVRINENNRKQAEVPGSAIILNNELGTAPGLWFEKEGKIFVSLPGVPFEMKALMNASVIPGLREMFSFPVIIQKTVITHGTPEAHLAELLRSFEAELPQAMTLAYLPSPGLIRLRLVSVGDNPDEIQRAVEAQITKLLGIIPEYVVGFDDDTLEKIIGDLLRSRYQTVSTGESCTGGTIASIITSIPGSSDYFKGGIVAYSNEIKRDQLAIDPYLLDSYGAVSKPVVEEMANNTRLLFNTDYSIAVSGIAGPSGGTEIKPVGTIWIAVSCSHKTLSREFRFGDNRERNIRRASVTALNMLRKLILEY